MKLILILLSTIDIFCFDRIVAISQILAQVRRLQQQPLLSYYFVYSSLFQMEQSIGHLQRQPCLSSETVWRVPARRMRLACVRYALHIHTLEILLKFLK